MVLGFGPTSTPPQRGGNETPAMPSGKIIIIAAGIVLLVAAMFAIFGGGDTDVSSSGGDGVGVSAGDSGSGGAVVPDDSDSESSAEFTPTAELTLSNGMVVKTRGLEIVMTEECDHDNYKTGFMYVLSGYVYSDPHTSVKIAIKKKKMGDISFSVDGVSVSNIRTEEFKGQHVVVILADIHIPEGKSVRAESKGFSSSKTMSFYMDNAAVLPQLGFANEDKWKNTELIIIQLSVQNK